MTDRVIVVTGSRHLKGWAVTCALSCSKPNLVLVGDCPTGADIMARTWCRRNGVPCHIFCAKRITQQPMAPHVAIQCSDWSVDGTRAGPIRNAAMVKRAAELGATMLAFPRGGPGTEGCIQLALDAGIRVTRL